MTTFLIGSVVVGLGLFVFIKLSTQEDANSLASVVEAARKNPPLPPEGQKDVILHEFFYKVSYYRLGNFGKFMKAYKGSWDVLVWAQHENSAKELTKKHIQHYENVWGNFTFEFISRKKLNKRGDESVEILSGNHY